MKVGPNKESLGLKKRDDPSQSRAFIKKAREIEAATGDSAVAESVLGNLAKTPPTPRRAKSDNVNRRPPEQSRRDGVE